MPSEQMRPLERAEESAHPTPAPAAHRRFVELLHELEGVLWEMDARTWRFTFVSERAERLFGFPVRRWYDEPTFWQDTLIHDADRDWCVNFCTIASKHCRNHAFLYRANTQDGRVIWIKDVVRVIADADGTPMAMRGVMVDATEEMAARAEESTIELDYDASELAPYRAILLSA